jgi:hypothetical protein
MARCVTVVAMLAARLALSSALLAAAVALSTEGSAPPVFDEPRVVGRLLDVDGEPYVGEVSFGSRVVFSQPSGTAFGVTVTTDASGAFDFCATRRKRRGTELAWTLTPRGSVSHDFFATAAHSARRAVGTLVFEGGEDGAVIGDIGTVQLVEAPRVASLHIECPVATTHEVVIGESDYENSSDGPFLFPYHALEVATGTTVDLFSWSTADRWYVFTRPATPRAEELMAAIERDQDLALFSCECFQVCISIDAPPTAQGAQRALFVVMPLRSATTGTRLGPHEEVGIHWISLGMQRRRGPVVFQLGHAEREFDLYLPGGLHRFEYWEYEHVLEGPRLVASAPVFVDRFVDLR